MGHGAFEFKTESDHWRWGKGFKGGFGRVKKNFVTPNTPECLRARTRWRALRVLWCIHTIVIKEAYTTHPAHTMCVRHRHNKKNSRVQPSYLVRRPSRVCLISESFFYTQPTPPRTKSPHQPQSSWLRHLGRAAAAAAAAAAAKNGGTSASAAAAAAAAVASLLRPKECGRLAQYR
jgi:hypothetical protein